jgi:hypothetical protein
MNSGSGFGSIQLLTRSTSLQLSAAFGFRIILLFDVKDY